MALIRPGEQELRSLADALGSPGVDALLRFMRDTYDAEDKALHRTDNDREMVGHQRSTRVLKHMIDTVTGAPETLKQLNKSGG